MEEEYKVYGEPIKEHDIEEDIQAILAEDEALNKRQMKKVKLGDYLLWEGKPAQIVAEVSERTLVIVGLEPRWCPHCQGELGKEQTWVVEDSPMFRNGARKLPTIDI